MAKIIRKMVEPIRAGNTVRSTLFIVSLVSMNHINQQKKKKSERNRKEREISNPRLWIRGEWGGECLTCAFKCNELSLYKSIANFKRSFLLLTCVTFVEGNSYCPWLFINCISRIDAYLNFNSTFSNETLLFAFNTNRIYSTFLCIKVLELILYALNLPSYREVHGRKRI